MLLIDSCKLLRTIAHFRWTRFWGAGHEDLHNLGDNPMDKDIHHVLDTLRHVKGNSSHCTLLIGAGCSVTAGIPAAGEMVEHIRKEFPNKCGSVDPPTYPHVMAQLAPDERRDVIAYFVDKAKINWAHVCIAQLMIGGYVDRILTTNFDPLVVRACALLGCYPAVYDFGVSQVFDPERVSEKAVFYLHGQRSSFIQLNTEDECQQYGENLKPLFDDAGRGRVWIVVGYSGENDPVFEQLVRVTRFNRGLYWVGYKEDGPREHVREKLLGEDKYAYFVRGHDADSFFIKLTQELDEFPPEFISKPFSHLDKCMKMLTPFPLDGKEKKTDVTATPGEWIAEAIEKYENHKDDLVEAERLYMAGKYSEVTDIPLPNDASAKLMDRVSWAHLRQGLSLFNEAETKSGEEAGALYEQACEKYAEALKIKPDIYDALSLWGFALGNLGKTKTGGEADALYTQAYEKCAEALKIKPDMHQALTNWSFALILQGNTKEGTEAQELYSEAREKLLAAESIVTGSGAFNLACISALQDHPDECREWLQKGLEADELPSLAHLEIETDLDSVRDLPWFKDFLQGR